MQKHACIAKINKSQWVVFYVHPVHCTYMIMLIMIHLDYTKTTESLLLDCTGETHPQSISAHPTVTKFL